MAVGKTTKFCNKCKTEKPVEMFSRHHRYKDGLQSHCKACHSRYLEANRERIAEQRRAYQKENREKRREWCLEYYAKNKDWILDQQREYYEANKQKVSASNEKWKALNLERVEANRKRWHLENPDAVRIYSHNRRARERESGGRLSSGLAERLFKLQRGKCACCGLPLGDDYHLDHIMPIALGGTNTDDNIQLLRSTCNQQKNAKHPVDFMRQRGFLL